MLRPAPVKPLITLDLLNQVDIRVGTIETVEDVERSDNLVKLKVNFDHRRTILAGVKKGTREP